ncbi:hypothetical protein LguiB_032699 [Lonicera macranthoides]
MGKWSMLPGDLLDVIEGNLLLYRDKVRVRSVCASWNSHLPKLPNQQLMQLPWLLQTYENGKEASHGLFNPFEKKFYHLDLPEAQGKLFKGSSHGWVVTIEDITCSRTPADIYLLNPLTRARIQLPPRSTFPDVKDYHPDRVGQEYAIFCELDDVEYRITCLQHLIHLTHRVVLSSTPSSQDCIVVAIYGEFRRLAFCKVKDEKWTRLHVPAPYLTFTFADVTFYKKKLYALYGNGQLIIIENIGPNPKVTEIVAVGLSRGAIHPLYLVESSDGNLIMVSRSVGIYDGKFSDSIVKTRFFKLYKLDLNSSNWVKVGNIGQDMLFLGCNSSTSISSRDFPGLKGNRVYYTDGPPSFGANRRKQEKSDIGVFILDDEVFDDIPGFKCGLKLLWPPPIWIIPSSM